MLCVCVWGGGGRTLSELEIRIWDCMDKMSVHNHFCADIFLISVLLDRFQLLTTIHDHGFTLLVHKHYGQATVLSYCLRWCLDIMSTRKQLTLCTENVQSLFQALHFVVVYWCLYLPYDEKHLEFRFWSSGIIQLSRLFLLWLDH